MVFFILLPSSFASEIRPLMVYDTDLVMDTSWNEAIHNGITRFEKKTKVDVKEINIVEVSSFARIVSEYIKKGYNPVIINNVDSGKDIIIKGIIQAYPKTRFIIFNGNFNIPNAYYFSFSYHEASFLAGYLASKKSKTAKLGFVGGMDIAIIRNFLCGYIQGAHYANPDIKIEWDFLGDNFLAWNMPDDAYRLALKQIDSGADIIYSPSGGSSVGALKAAYERGVLGIGVDRNQNHLFPGSVLTSVMVRVDNAAFRALLAAKRNIWGEQIKTMGLQENGVALAYDKYNAPLIFEALKKEVESIKAKIILKEIQIDDYTHTLECNIDGETLF